MVWFNWPWASRNARARAFSGTIPNPTSLVTNMTGLACLGRVTANRVAAAFPVPVMMHQVGKPEREAIDQTGASAVRRDKCVHQIKRFRDRPPFRPTSRLMSCNPVGHLVVKSLAGGDIGGVLTRRERPILRDQAFARTRATGDEYRLRHAAMTNQIAIEMGSEA